MSKDDRGAAARAAFIKMTQDRNADNAAAARAEESTPGEKDSVLESFFYCKPRFYLYKSEKQFIPQDKDSIRMRLRRDKYSDAEISNLLLQIEECNHVPLTFPMQPARRAGVYCSDGQRYIIMNDYPFPFPIGSEGKCEVILQVLRSLFGDEQMPYFLAWMQGARRRIKDCLEYGDYSTECQIMCVLGAPSLGKTNILCKHILRPLFGGSWVDYGEMLIHGKQFNGELMNSCLLLADDKGKPQGYGARRRMADTMKNIGYSGSYCIESKGKTAISVRAPWVQIVLANDDDSGLESVPDFSGMEDKFIALHAEVRPDFPPNNTPGERKALDSSIAAELPAFAWYVDHYSPPLEVQEAGSRHACKAYIAPSIEKLLKPLTEEAKLMNAIEILISDPVSSDIDTVCADSGISATALQAYLKRRCLWRDENNRAIGRKLTRLCELYPDKIRKRQGHKGLISYIITRPADVPGVDDS